MEKKKKKESNGNAIDTGDRRREGGELLALQ